MPSIKDRLYKQAIKNRIPLTSAFELSPLCNFSCKMCYVRKSAEEVRREGGIKTLDFWLDIAQQAKRSGNLVSSSDRRGGISLSPYPGAV